MSKPDGSEDLRPGEVAAYLRKNPDFFVKYPDLAKYFELESAQKTNVIPIKNKQLKKIQQDKSKLETSLENLLEIAEQNDKLADQIHRITIDLINSTDLENLIIKFHSNLTNEFKVQHSALRLWNIGKKIPKRLVSNDPSLLSFAEELSGPNFSQKLFKQIVGTFEFESDDGSYAYCPIRTTKTFGILILFSSDKNHYARQKDTVYLRRLVELLAHNIWRLN